jgi:hypothetical protein
MSITETMMTMITDKMMEGVNAMWSSLGNAMIEGAKAHWKEITLAVLALVVGGKLIGAAVGGIMGGGAKGGSQPGGEFSAMKALGGSFAEAAGWLMKGVAIGASMIAIGKGLEFLADGVKSFEGISADALIAAGAGLTAMVTAITLFSKLGPALLNPKAIAGIALIEAAIAGLGFALSFFPADLLRAFGDVVGKTFAGMSSIVDSAGAAIERVVNSIEKLRQGVMDATTKQIRDLSDIPSEKINATAGAIENLKQALDGFAPGLFSGISQGLGNLFSPDKVGPLDKMAELGPRLTVAAEGFTAFKAAMAGFSLANLDISNGQVSNFIRMSDKFPDFNQGIAGLTKQADNINNTARAFDAFVQATHGFDIAKFTFTREQLASLADGTVKLRALAEQLKLSSEGFKKLDDQGLKNIKEGIVSLSTEMKALTLFLQGDFAAALDAIRSKDQLGLLSDLGGKLDTLNSSVASLIQIEDASKGHLDKLASGTKPTLKK